jgi:hypothetical protein
MLGILNTNKQCSVSIVALHSYKIVLPHHSSYI